MHYDYVVTLKKESAHKTDQVSFILLGFSVLAFSYQQIRSGFSLYLSVASMILLAGMLISLKQMRAGKEIHFRIWLFVAGLFWLGMPFLQWLILPFFLLGFLEVQAKRALEIGFNPDGLLINSLFKKKIPWTALRSVILKDDLLTIDFLNNRLFQKEILDDGESDTSDDEFNEYCRSKLLNLR